MLLKLKYIFVKSRCRFGLIELNSKLKNHMLILQGLETEKKLKGTKKIQSLLKNGMFLFNFQNNLGLKYIFRLYKI